MLAETLVSATERRTPATLDTLAAAYAESGRFDDAVRVMDEGLRLATELGLPESRVRAYETRRAQYAAGRAHRTN
jgi:pentatricopeptide repeat protein